MVVLAHEAPGLGSLGFSPTLTVYLTLALLGLLALYLRMDQRQRPVAVSTDDAWPGEQLAPLAQVLLRVLGLAGLFFLLACGWLGSHQIGANPISIGMFWVFWVGGQLLSVLIGDWWRLVHPYDTLAGWIDGLLGRGRTEAATRRDDGDWWVPAALLASFTWMWLCWPEGIRPRWAAAWLTAYTATMLVGAALGGRRWVRRNEAFATAFGAIAAASPLDWSGRRPRWRNPIAELSIRSMDRRQLATVTVMLATVLFDAIGSSVWWADLVGVRSMLGYTAFNTFGLGWLVLTVGAVWTAVARAAVGLAAPHEIEMEIHDLDHDSPATASVARYSLGAPLAVLAAGFAISHESSELLRNTQNFVALMSDPFNQGWNLLGTASMVVNPSFPSPVSQAWIALALIVVAVLVTYMGLHARVVAFFGPERSLHASWAMLGFVSVASVIGLQLMLGA